MATFTVRQGKRYRATVTLGGIERWASNEMIASRLRDAGFSEVAYRVLYHSPETMMASYLAFTISQVTMLFTWRLLSPTLPIVLAALMASWVCQAVDTPIFFGLAFARAWTASEILTAIEAGFVFKCVLAVLFTPALMAAIRVSMRDGKMPTGTRSEC